MQTINKNLGIVPDWYFSLADQNQLGFVIADDPIAGVREALDFYDWLKKHKTKILIGMGGLLGASFIGALLK